MDFDKLQTFYHVASSGSITLATKALGMDKSSVSRQLSLLEGQVGKKLFERQGKKLILTPHGNFLYEKSRHILMEIEATKAALLSDSEQVTGTLTITTTHALTSSWLTHFIHKFIEQHPAIKLQIKASNQPLDLSLREADMAIRPYCPDQENLIQKHLMSWRLRLYASKEYIKKFGKPLNPKDLDNHRLIIFGDTPNLYPYNHTNWPLTIKITNGKIRTPFLVINSLEGMFNLVANGVGIGNFGENLPEVKEYDLVPILPDQIHHDIHAYFIYHKQFQGLGVIEAMDKFLTNHVKKYEKFPPGTGKITQ